MDPHNRYAPPEGDAPFCEYLKAMNKPRHYEIDWHKTLTRWFLAVGVLAFWTFVIWHITGGMS